MLQRMVTFAIFDNLNSKQWAIKKQKWRWAVFLKADCTKELSPEIYVSVKEGSTPTSLLAPSLSAGLSLSNKTRIYWNVVVFAFQTQYIQKL